jgi:hypothetical protein
MWKNRDRDIKLEKVIIVEYIVTWVTNSDLPYKGDNDEST